MDMDLCLKKAYIKTSQPALMQIMQTGIVYLVVADKVSTDFLILRFLIA